MSIRDDTKEIAWQLWQLCNGATVVVSRGNRRKAAKVARARLLPANPGDGLWRYQLNPERIKEIRSWYDKEGRLIQPQKLLDAIWEGPLKQPKQKKPPDMLAAYKRKLLRENDS